ncbi:hypothetical protein JCM11641_002689 [Rhodosporidiobolus odoratus]
MRAPVDTNSLPPALAARFAALRSTSNPPTSSSSRSGDTGDDILSRRLAQLETPTTDSRYSVLEEGEEGRVEVEVKTPDGSFTTLRDPVEHFLATLPSSPSSSPSLARSSSPPRQRQPLESGSRPSQDAVLSGIEVAFMRPSFGAAVGDLPGVRGGRGDEEDELVRRMRDEVELEGKVRRREEETAEEWEKRLERLKGVVPGSAAVREGTGVPEGSPPGLGELERAVEKRKRKERRKSGREDGSSNEEDTDSESDESSESTASE